MNRFWYDSPFDANSSARKILLPHQFFNVLKVKMSIAVAELEHCYIVTVPMGVSGCETLQGVEGFSVFFLIPQTFNKI